ncbi:hypothetical protein Pyn_17462 [Prunus yedoensis var. nudiflora]|uniref:Uncharacterized protein n=1 Tax=Prunus yedoensis var. nudiflora TaxID=2094558 RepID=A0A314UC26_PRUYE|nr:hypothetical protein Pyn_17462 [Prunus yedoensis var. nudiflora]
MEHFSPSALSVNLRGKGGSPALWASVIPVLESQNSCIVEYTFGDGRYEVTVDDYDKLLIPQEDHRI